MLQSIEVKQTPKNADKKLVKLNKKMGPSFIKVTNKKISILLFKWVLDNFKTQGGKVGRWRRLKLGGRYIGKGSGRTLDSSAKILQDTGALRISFRPFSSIKEAGVGSNKKYAKVHEVGSKNIPKRRMLPLNKDVSLEANKIVSLEFKKEKRRNGIN